MRNQYKVLSEKYQLVTEQTEEPVMEIDKYGNKEWFLNGERHRTDGPAVEFANGDKMWGLNGVLYTKKEWKEQMELRQGLKDLALIRTKFK